MLRLRTAAIQQKSSLKLAACETGDFSNGVKYGDLGNRMREFKCHQIRIPFTYCTQQRGMIVATHGFIKKQNLHQETEQGAETGDCSAWRIFKEDQSTLPDPPKLELIQGKKK